MATQLHRAGEPSSVGTLGRRVGEGGLEPPRPFGHRHLKPARLPIPPLARAGGASLPTGVFRPLVRGSGHRRRTRRPTRTLAPVGLQGFERTARAAGGGHASTRPSAAGSSPSRSVARMTRVLDAGRTLGVDGVPVAPNNIGVYLSPDDFERFQLVRRGARPRARRGRPRARPRRGLPVRRSGHRHARRRRRARRGRVRRRRRDRRGRCGRGLARAPRRPAGPARRAHRSCSGASPTATS